LFCSGSEFNFIAQVGHHNLVKFHFRLSRFYESISIKLGLESKIKFLGRLPFQELNEVTRKADLGISLEEDLGLNYRFALPNKLFDYIQAGVPVLVSDLPEMRRIVEQYKIGMIAETHLRKELVEVIKAALFDLEKRYTWMKNMPLAAKELCWENEEKILRDIYFPYHSE